MAQVKFWRGAANSYSASTHANGIYFATDTQEIYLDGKTYGGVAEDAAALKKAFVKAEYTAATASAAGYVTLTAKDETTTVITLPSVAAGNGVDVTCGEKGAYTVAVKLDTTKNKLATLGTDGLAVTAKLNWDSTSKKMQLLDGSDAVVSEFDGTAFVKDGILDSVQIKDEKLTFTWNTDAGKDVTEIPLTDIFNPYTIGNGLNHDTTNNTLEVVVKEGEKFIAVGSDGLYTTTAFATLDASVKANEDAIALLNGADTETGSVAKAVADAKSDVIGGAADAKTADTVYGAKAFATDAVSTAKTELQGTADDTKDSATIAGAKKYADAKDEELATALKGGATDESSAETIAGAKAFATSAVEAALLWNEVTA